MIIGNIPKARDTKDPDKNWKFTQANAVLTRQQARKEGEGKNPEPLCVLDIIDTDVSPDDIKAAQDEDETLVQIRTMVGQDADNSKVYCLENEVSFILFFSQMNLKMANDYCI